MGEARSNPSGSAPAVSDALLRIAQVGHLLSLVLDRAQRLQLMKVMTDQKLIVWNKAAAKYELTAFGRRCLEHAGANAGPWALKAS